MARLEAYRGFAASAAEHGFVLVRVVEAKGSTPRNTDAWMLVSGNGCFGTIGGGRLELEAIDRAREVLAGAAAQPMALPLGPAIGQCCGGHVTLSFEVIPPARFDRDRGTGRGGRRARSRGLAVRWRSCRPGAGSGAAVVAGQGSCGGDAGRRAGSHADGRGTASDRPARKPGGRALRREARSSC
jgi:xanthine/CO dehydrogenase XdhC/CoxF family maturation factor